MAHVMSEKFTPTRTLTIIAQDPSILDASGNIVTAEIEVPNENLGPGPRGYRVQIVDYDAASEVLYTPIAGGKMGSVEEPVDPFRGVKGRKLVGDPHFHAQNVYAIVMRTLARFEFALGRRVSWSFGGHQLKAAPHAFAMANAFYSRRDEALLFGYFPAAMRRDGMVFTCLSHDVVAHETTHALVDGLRERYTDPSSPEQAGFHEGFADIVALLSVFSMPEVVSLLLEKGLGKRDRRTIRAEALDMEQLRDTALLNLAEDMGSQLSGLRGNPLRRSVALKPSREYMDDPAFLEPHRRGEILVAAVMNAFLSVWIRRLQSLGKLENGEVNRARVVEEGAEIASRLLTMCVRAIDYSPPTDLQFCDFLSALVTADREVAPNDTRYQFRSTLLELFAQYGMEPTSKADSGYWEPPADDRGRPLKLDYRYTHFEAMHREPDEVFRFIWENRGALGLCEEAFTRVQSVRPCIRVGPDGFVLRETVAEYIQILKVRASELNGVRIPGRRGDTTIRRIEKPAGMPGTQDVTLYGGGALIFDENGQLKFHVRNAILNAERQTRRLKYLWQYGFFEGTPVRRFASLHQQRMMDIPAGLDAELLQMEERG